MRGDIDLSRRSSSLSSSRIGDYECREDEVLGEGRRRHIVRSGGRHGTEILSTYQRGLDEDPTFRIRKRPREEFHLAQPSLQVMGPLVRTEAVINRNAMKEESCMSRRAEV